MLTFITSFLFSHLSVLLGYGICVLFPVPWLNSSIISVWQSVGSKLMDSIKSALPASFTKAEDALKASTVK